MCRRPINTKNRTWSWSGRRTGALVLLALLCLASPAVADPQYEGPIFYGLDPILRATRDPRLLGVERMIMRERLLAQGVDPWLDPVSPTLHTVMKALIVKRGGLDLEHEEVVTEANGMSGLYSIFRYPDWFYLFPTERRLPGGFTYYPSRPVDAPEVSVFVDDVNLGLQRQWAVQGEIARLDDLDVSGSKSRSSRDQGLINLTIPVKLPRTLEKVIGRGEKTSIKITGREHISIGGEVSRSNQFTPNERNQSQSWFPDLDMQQQLQVNLSGQIGEKIFIEVDHNSEAIGPEGTKIKLSYVGDEDEVIHSIETGDVGLTLPGGQLLGYNSNKSGLFGIKVTGQVGRTNFTAVASKQKAESDSKSFNSRGGQVSEHVISASSYLNNRFFRLDLVPYVNHEILGYTQADFPGRGNGEFIDLASIRVYRNLGSVTARDGDVTFGAAIIDTTGRWDDQGYISSISDDPSRWVSAWTWRPLDLVFLRDVDDNLVAVDLKQEMFDTDILAVVYQVVDDTGAVLYTVGDHPDLLGERGIEIGGQGYYRFKLLKPEQRDPFTFQYVLRNIYPLGGTNIDAESFELRIEYKQNVEHPDLHGTNGLDYLRLFGLDSENPQGEKIPDGVVDKHNTLIFDLNNGLLRFPLDFPFPFKDEGVVDDRGKTYREFANAPDIWEWEGTDLEQSIDGVRFYDWDALPTNYHQTANFNLVAVHAAASSVISLGASNIQEDSETVVLDGQTLARGTDYTIDYLFGTVELKGEAAGRLTPDSNIQVNYQFSPFFGGGQSSLLGLNLGYDLGRESKLTTTWLYESSAIVGEKAKLGEEPSRNLVGNLNLNHTFKSNLLTRVANIVARGRRDRESTLAVSGEAAVSIPNPNTRDRAYLEDFEGSASSDIVTLGRLGWYRASLPLFADNDPFRDQSLRLSDIRWFAPKTRVLRRWLNPELVGQERDETQQAIELFLKEGGTGGWNSDSWGGIMRGLGRAGLDLSKSQFIEIWINDARQNLADRRGKLHIDFGTISEDFEWPEVDGAPEYETPQFEDRNRDGIFATHQEDVGLDAVINMENGEVIREGAEYSVDEGDLTNDPYPGINNTARNNYEDGEDLDGDTRFNVQNGYFTVTIDLAETEAMVDVAQDYPGEDLEGTAWRKYRIRLADVLIREDLATADVAAVKQLRIWYEDEDSGAPESLRLQLSELAFLGSRWEREGIRKVATEAILGPGDLAEDESFFIGEINNKDNPGYEPPFPVREENGIPEKESSLVLDFNDLGPDHLLRIQKQVSAQGDDYTGYETMSWWWHGGSADVADLDLFYRFGADSTNYYEVSMRYIDTAYRTGWRNVKLDIAELTNIKNVEPDEDGIIRSEINDIVDGQTYQVNIRGRPDLRRVIRFYLGVANHTQRHVSGQIWVNDVVVEGAKRDIGLAEKVALRLNMADVLKVDFDWNRRDSEYRGLNEDRGKGVDTESWSLSTNFRVDDFLPLFGFQLPVSFSRRAATSRPKYEINSDIEIAEEDRRNDLSSLEERESFSVRLSRRPSRSFIPRYVIDPWTVQLSGSRSSRVTPTENSAQTGLQGSVNYNLQIQSDFGLGDLPLLGFVPLLGSLRLLPNRVQVGGNFTYTDRQSIRKDLDGTIYPATGARTKPATLNGDLEYRPLTIVKLNFKNRSERDLLRRQEWNGINIGEQNKYGQDYTLTFTVPKATQMPQAALYAPLRTVVRGLNKLRPSLTFQAAFIRDTNPGSRQEGDPDDVRSVSNSNDWQARAQFPLGDVFKDVFPERRGSDAAEQSLEDEIARLKQDARRDPTLQFDPTTVDGYDRMTQDEQQEEEDDFYRELAIERMEAEGRKVPGGGGLFSPRDLIEPLLGALRGIQPISVSYTRGRSSGYGRLTGDTVGLDYLLGFNTEPDLADTAYSSRRNNQSENLSVSSNTRLTRTLQLDVKYSLARSNQRANETQTWNYSQDWPDVRLNLTGIEKWGLFGGDPDDREAGLFKTSSIDVSYKHTKNVPNFTETFHNPRRSTTISPRWSLTFHSGMSVTINGSLSKEHQVSSGAASNTRRFQAGLQFQHQIQAQAFLAKMGLYRPGNQPTLNLGLDLRFSRNTTDREVAGSNFTQATQGTQTITVTPRMSYDITRNLSGAFNLNFSQNKNLATDLVSTTVGLGLEATFVF